MTTFNAIYENGVFRPLGKVDLPERTKVRVEPLSPNDSEQVDDQADIWEVLSWRGQGDDPRVSERHNEHQP